jgi:hypothetical protein
MKYWRDIYFHLDGQRGSNRGPMSPENQGPKGTGPIGSNKPRKRPKTVVQEVRRAKTNQRDSKRVLNYEIANRRFDFSRLPVSTAPASVP